MIEAWVKVGPGRPGVCSCTIRCCQPPGAPTAHRPQQKVRNLKRDEKASERVEISSELPTASGCGRSLAVKATAEEHSASRSKPDNKDGMKLCKMEDKF